MMNSDRSSFLWSRGAALLVRSRAVAAAVAAAAAEAAPMAALKVEVCGVVDR